MLRCVLVSLLLTVVSSAPLSSDDDSWSASSSDEDLQLPAVGGASRKAPPSMIVNVEDTKTNITLSFAIFIMPEEQEEGSGVDGGGSDDSTESDDDSSEEATSQEVQPITSLLHSPEEMTNNQPMSTSDEEVDGFKNSRKKRLVLLDGSDEFIGSKVNQKMINSDKSDDVNNHTEKIGPSSVTVTDLPDGKNTTKSEGFNNSKETVVGPFSHDYDELYNSHVTDSQDIKTTSDGPPSSVSDHFSNTFSPKVPDHPQNLKGVASNPGGQRFHQTSDTDTTDLIDVDLFFQEVTTPSPGNQDRVSSSIGSINNIKSGSRLQKVFKTMTEVVDQVSDNLDRKEVKEKHQNVLSTTHNWGDGFGISPDGTLESLSINRIQSNPENQTSFSSESQVATVLIKNASGYSVKEITSPTKTSTSDLVILEGASRKVRDGPVKSFQADKGTGLNPASPDHGVRPMSLSIPNNTKSQISVKDSIMFPSQMDAALISDSSEESQESDDTLKVPGLKSSQETFSVGSDSNSVSSENLAAASGNHTRAGSENSPQQVLDGASTEVQNNLKVIQPNNQVVSPMILDLPNNTTFQVRGKFRTRLPSRIEVGLISDSSEEFQQSDDPHKVVASASPGPGLHGSGSHEESSSSEEASLALSFSSTPPSVLVPLVLTESESSESEESGVSKSGPKLNLTGFDSSSEFQSSKHQPKPVPTPVHSPEVHLGSLADLSSSSETTEKTTTTNNSEDATPTVGSVASTVSIASSSEHGFEPPSDVKDISLNTIVDTGADLSHDVSTDKYYNTVTVSTTMTVSLGASRYDANTDAGGDLSGEEDVTKGPKSEGFTVSMKPTAPTEYISHLPVPSTNANANIKKELVGSDAGSGANTGANKPASHEEDIASPLPPSPLPPARRRKPFRSGYLSPIRHSHGNQELASRQHQRETAHLQHQRGHSNSHQVFFSRQQDAGRKPRPQAPSHQPNRKLTKVRLANVAKLAQSSSEET